MRSLEKITCEKCGERNAECCCASAGGFSPSQQSLYGYEQMCDELTGYTWALNTSVWPQVGECRGNPAARKEKDCVCAAPKTFTSKDVCEEHARLAIQGGLR